MKVALIQCPVWGTREPPLGIVQLSGCLKSRGIDTKSFDFNNYIYRNREDKFRNLWAWEQSMFWYNKREVDDFFNSYSDIVDSYINRILKFKPKVAGFSVSASTFYASCRFAQRLKEVKGDIKIVFGGQAFFDRGYVEKSFRNSPVDFILTGEADLTFPNLVIYLEQGMGLEDCLGVYLRQPGGKISYTGRRPLLENLDKIAYSDFSDLKIDDYDDNEHVSIMTSRGCVWNCAFCSSRAFWGKYRYMSGERIHQEISYHRMMRNSLGHLDCMDLVFNGNMRRVEEFCELMIKYPPFPAHPRIKWVANAIVHPGFTKDIFAMMAESGCKKLIFGIESGSERVLKLMNKPFKISVAKRIIKDAVEAGIQVTNNFMFGFPGETEEDFQKTIDFVKEIGPYVERVYPSRTYCAMEEFSYIYEHPKKFGVKTPFNHHLYWETTDGKNNYPVRLKRCAKFEKLCNKLNIQVDCGVMTSVDMDNWYNLGNYYQFSGNFSEAAKYYRRYLKEDPSSQDIRNKLKKVQNQIRDKAK